MSSIIDLSAIASTIGQPITLWRDQLLPATFADQQFHCEANSREGGQRAVTHEFPKRDLPYTETMGRRAMEFSVRGYTIAYPFDTDQPLYQRDYRQPRDNLINALDAGLPGVLQLPTQAPMWVVCTRYRMNEEERFGGYCVFDMTFIEYGKTQNPAPDVSAALLAASQTLIARTMDVLAQAPPPPKFGS
jgi:prophage DNA circulation protein